MNAVVPSKSYLTIFHQEVFMVMKNLVRKCAYKLFRLIINGLFDYSVRGEENIPENGPLMLIANHSSFVDIPMLGMVIFGRLLDSTWIISKGNYRLWFMKWFWGLFDTIVADGGTVKNMCKAIDKGRVVVIFPEGNRAWCCNRKSNDGKKRTTGAACAALLKGVTILPVNIYGADKVMPAGGCKLDLKERITVTIGKPFSFEAVDEDKIDEKLLEITSINMVEKIDRLSPAYVPPAEKRPAIEREPEPVQKSLHSMPPTVTREPAPTPANKPRHTHAISAPGGELPRKERRAGERFKSEFPAAYTLPDEHGEKDTCRAMDISEGGIGLSVDKELAEGIPMTLVLDIPGTKEEIRAKGEVVWSKEITKDRGVFRSGVKFTSLKESDKARLIKYIRSLSKPSH